MNVEASSFTIDTIPLDLLGVRGRSPRKHFSLFSKRIYQFRTLKWSMIKKNIGNHFKIKGRG
eukprot:UN20652